jgi:hypothetical protein
MRPNNLGVRVGSLHLYQDDVDQEDHHVQQETETGSVSFSTLKGYSSNMKVSKTEIFLHF